MAAKPKQTGRPSSYRPEFDGQAEKLCLLGATDKDLASFFDVSEVTVNAWKQAHPSFLKSLRIGKTTADARVAERLFNRALGYSHPEDKIFNDDGVPLIVPTTKHYPPDTTACIFWLKNRRPEEWRDRVVQEITGANGGPIQTEDVSARDYVLSHLTAVSERMHDKTTKH